MTVPLIMKCLPFLQRIGLFLEINRDLDPMTP